MKEQPRTIDPASIRYEIAGRVYYIGQRVRTPDGDGTITWFGFTDNNNIRVRLDGQRRRRWLTWQDVEPLDPDIP